MNFIYNIYNYCKDTFYSYYDQRSKKEIIKTPENLIKDNDNQDNDNQDNDNQDYHIYYFFINTANINNATELLIERLNNEYYDQRSKKIKIYLLKNDTIKPLFYNDYILANNKNIKKIHRKLKTKGSKHKRYLHTFVDAIDSFIEYNTVRNYTIFY